MSADQTRVALSPDVTRDDVETAAWVMDFFIDHRTDGDKDTPREDVWRTIDEKTWLHEVEDPVTGLRFLVVRGEDRDKHVRRIRKELDTVTHTEALKALKAASSRDDKLEALYQTGIAAPEEPNQRVVSALTKALEGEDDYHLRQAALIAIAYTSWPDFKAAVKTAAEDDESEAVRSTAHGMLKAFK
ncbi:hypothetical protein OJ997_20840 [Solirubrobacter phytolaccae]|uniref:HEAT repeat domain-containing protein n=1 Tax=Solirubrobacter phytolaccae TaxID=1404360 RepID=A0A9X3NJZ8_9ACTN|nr:hypothetical protein [Solirubrobacter phytolaccae]MDA0182772.1 hypothetical protein [Solirubrobacter phytolaccae]